MESECKHTKEHKKDWEYHGVDRATGCWVYWCPHCKLEIGIPITC